MLLHLSYTQIVSQSSTSPRNGENVPLELAPNLFDRFHCNFRWLDKYAVAVLTTQIVLLCGT